VTVTTPTFGEIFVRVMLGLTIPENTPAKFEVRTFSRFGTDRQTDRNRPIRNDSVVNDYCWRLETGHRTPDTGHHFQVVLYSVQCCYAVHWTDKKWLRVGKVIAKKAVCSFWPTRYWATEYTVEQGDRSVEHGNEGIVGPKTLKRVLTSSALKVSVQCAHVPGKLTAVN